MKVTYSKGVCLLSKCACANLYGGTGGGTDGSNGAGKKPKNGGSTTTPTGGVIPAVPDPEPDPDF